MTKSPDAYPKSLKLFGWLLVISGAYLLANIFLFYDSGSLHLVDLSDKTIKDIIDSLIFRGAPMVAGIGLILRKPWGRMLVVVFLFIGFVGLSISIAAMGLYGNEVMFAAGFALLVFVTWFINRESVRDALPPTKRERISYILLPVLLLAVAGGWAYFWVDFGGPALPPVQETPLPRMPSVPAVETYTYMLPGRFSIEVPDEYQLWYLDVNGMSLNKKGAGKRFAIVNMTTLQETGGNEVFTTYFDNPLGYADKYFHERYGLGFTAIRRVLSLIGHENGYKVYHIENDGMDIYIESGYGELTYTETAHIYSDGEVLGGVVYEVQDKNGISPPEGLILPILLASARRLGDDFSAGDLSAKADRSYAEGDMKAAILNYTYSLMVGPDDPEVLFRLASAYELNGQLKESRDTLLQATKISPSDTRISSKFREIRKRVKLEQAEMRGEL